MEKYEQTAFNIAFGVLVAVIGLSMLYHFYMAFFTEYPNPFRLLEFVRVDLMNLISSYFISSTFILTLFGLIPIYLILKLESQYKIKKIFDKQVFGLFIISVLILSGSASIILWNYYNPVLPKGDQAANFHLVNQDNETVTIDSYLGKILVIDFIYTNCPDPEYCPASSLKMRELHNKIINKGISSDDVHLISISFDYFYDGPIQMKNYGLRYGADFSYWSFLSGNNSVLEIAQSYGVIANSVNVTELTFIAFAHTLMLTIVDQDGFVRASHHDNFWTSDQVISEVSSLL